MHTGCKEDRLVWKDLQRQYLLVSRRLLHKNIVSAIANKCGGFGKGGLSVELAEQGDSVLYWVKNSTFRPDDGD